MTTADDQILHWLCADATLAPWAFEYEHRLLMSWRVWSRANDHEPAGRAVVRQALAALGCERRGEGDLSVWLGVTLAQPEDTGAPALADRLMRASIARGRRHAARALRRQTVTIGVVAQSRLADTQELCQVCESL